MIQNKNQDILFTWMEKICMFKLRQNFFQLTDSNGMILTNNSRDCVLEVHLEYPEEIYKLHTMIIH